MNNKGGRSMKKLSNRKDNNKGFTLVELIVVLVILAILAAILVPALLGYIDKAKQKQYVLNARSVLTAAQAELTQAYGEGKSPLVDGDAIQTTADVLGDFEIYVATANVDKDTKAVATNHEAYTVSKVLYIEDGYYLLYEDGAWNTSTTKPTVSGGTKVASYTAPAATE
jgi:prepilin-type N-terminal cleavage/methylation domain-containing protein